MVNYENTLIKIHQFSCRMGWIFFLFFFFLFVFFNAHWSCFYFLFFFILPLFNLIWEIHFEGRDLINKTSSNTDPLTSLSSMKEKRETCMWVWPKTQTQMLLCLAMGLSPTILHQQHRQEPTDEVLRKKKKKRRKRRALNVLEFGGMTGKKKGGKKDK